MRSGVVVIALLGMPGLAAAGGPVAETKLSRTVTGAELGAHVMPVESGDGGLLAFGWSVGDWQALLAVMGHDVVTVNGGAADDLAMFGVDLRNHQPLTSRLDLSLRGGLFGAALYGARDTPLEDYRGQGLRAGAGVRVRTVTCQGATLNVTAEVVRNQLWLSNDSGKDLRDHATSALIGLEYTARDTGARSCAW
jgi:hypothetical protein